MSLQFTKAVEAKQVAQQDAERARFVVMKADQVGPAVKSPQCLTQVAAPLRLLPNRVWLLVSAQVPCSGLLKPAHVCNHSRVLVTLACADGHAMMALKGSRFILKLSYNKQLKTFLS